LKLSIKIIRTLHCGKIIWVKAMLSAVWVFTYSHISKYIVISWQVDGVCFGRSITLIFLSAKNIEWSSCIVALSIYIFTIPPD